MRMPEFTAEASLYKTSEPYRMLGGPNGFAGGQVVLPQRWSCRCTAWCPDPSQNSHRPSCCATECHWIPDVIIFPF
jgi:hypothetical protein